MTWALNTCDRTSNCGASLHHDDCLFVRRRLEQRLRLEQCATHGHDFNVTRRGDDEPVALFCDQCGKSWRIAGRAR